jgi:hypothetical protein
MKRQVILILAVTTIVALMGFTVAFANQSQNGVATESSSVESTLTATEKGILGALAEDIKTTQDNNLLTDEGKLRIIVSDVFLAMNNCEKEAMAFQLANVFNEGSDSAKRSYEFRKNKIQFVNDLRKRDGARMLWDNVCIDFKDVAINGDEATLDLIADRQYVDGKQANGISASQIAYTVKLVKTGGKWLIDSITSENEFDKEYQDKGFTAEQMLAEYDRQAKKVETIISKPKPSKDHVNALLWTASYNRSLASSYATTYALNYNANFYKWSSDCQNFGSQCVWYGLGGSNTATAIKGRYKPMVIEPANDAEKWWQTGTTGGYDPRGTWIRVIAFRDHIADWAKSYGVFGSVVTGSVKNTEVGDIIQIKNTSGVWYHTYVVDAVDGTYGSRTPSNIWVSAHTVNRKHEKLSTLGLSESNMRLVKISSAIGPQ